jgi:hypothetical protein
VKIKFCYATLTSALGGVLLASTCVAPAPVKAQVSSSIKFTGTSPAFTLAPPGTVQFPSNISNIVTTPTATGLFSGATSWIAQNGTSNIVSLAFQSTGVPSPVSLRFNSFTIGGNCTLCGFVNSPANGFNISPPVYVPGLATSSLTAQVPTISGSFPVTFNSSSLYTGILTFNAISSGAFSLEINATPAPVPSPLPLLGAGVAFSWSRKMRKRIHSSRKIAA